MFDFMHSLTKMVQNTVFSFIICTLYSKNIIEIFKYFE